MDITRNAHLLAKQQKILTKIALGVKLKEILEDICLAIEDSIQDKTAKCSILSLLDEELVTIASPSITPEYSKAIKGLKISPLFRSPDTAANQKSQIIPEDIKNSDLWIKFLDIAKKFNFQSCWPTPILSTTSETLGVLSIYHSQPKTATKEELELIDHFVHLSSIAFEKEAHSHKVKQLINDLKVTNQKLHSLIKVMPDPAIVVNKDGVYIDVYTASDNLLSGPSKQLIGQNLQDILSTSDAKLAMSMIQKTLETNEIHIFEYNLTINSRAMIFEGRIIPINYNNQGIEQQNILWIIRDISNRKASEKEIKTLAYYDHLTNLPNRRMLTEKLNTYVKKISQTNNKGALLFLDLDNFKRINDSLGHNAGDELLIEIAHRLSSKIKNPNILARIGGDEFIALLENLPKEIEYAKKDTIKVAQKLLKVFDEKFEIGQLAFKISGSIGICLIEDNNLSAEKILQFSDTAMYRAKAHRGAGYSFYDSKLQTQLEKQTALESDIIRGIDNKEFCTYFQPQVNTFGNITGAEALIRWNHPNKGFILPHDFISIAEQFGLIQKLQNIVLEDLCRLVHVLSKEKIIDYTFNIAINISQSQFNSATLQKELLTIMNTLSVIPSRIKLEITETMLSHDQKYAIQQMQGLKELGFTFSIDDFGTGYSCLSTLSAYPVDELKIDKSFIDKMLNNESGLPIVRTIINLAKSLSMKVVAEGVQEEQQLEVLKKEGVDAIQGYLIAKPMSLDNYLTWHRAYAKAL